MVEDINLPSDPLHNDNIGDGVHRGDAESRRGTSILSLYLCEHDIYEIGSHHLPTIPIHYRLMSSSSVFS